jgi:trigger factor
MRLCASCNSGVINLTRINQLRMNISRENIDALNARIKVQVVKADYDEKVDKVLRDYRKKAKFDGFRPGMVPLGLVGKLYRKPVMLDEINKLVAESINHYFETEQLQILGEPLPSEKQEKQIDWDTQEEFEFVFDIGLAPELKLDLNSKMKIPYYKVPVEDAMIDRYIDEVAQRYGIFSVVDTIEGGEMLKGDFTQLNPDGTPMANGIAGSEIIISLPVITDEEIKQLFAGKKVADVVTFDIRKAFTNETDLVNMLKVDRKDIARVSGNFSYMISEIKKYGKASIDQDLFDRVYGKDAVKSVEEFRSKIATELEPALAHDCEYRFAIDVRKALLEKTKIELPVDFLKRWMLVSNEGKVTAEQIESEFHHFEDDLRWQMVVNKIGKDNDIKLTEDDMKSAAVDNIRSQFARYGMHQIPDENLLSYAQDILNKPEERRKIAERKLEEKIITFVKQTITVDEKTITEEAFKKLFEN